MEQRSPYCRREQEEPGPLPAPGQPRCRAGRAEQLCPCHYHSADNSDADISFTGKTATRTRKVSIKGPNS